MNEGTARQIANAFLHKFEFPTFIQFFGGEPSLNLAAVRAFCNETFRAADAGKIARPPAFAIVTNGASSHNRDLVRCCKEYQIRVTISIDGPQAIHDMLRPSAGRGGSFLKVLNTVWQMRDVGIEPAAEVVYSSAHIDHQISVIEVLSFLSHLGFRKVILHTAYPPAPNDLCPFDDAHFEALVEYFTNAVDWWFHTLLHGDGQHLDVYFADLLRPLLNGVGISVPGVGCPAAVQDIAVGPKGQAYGCHLLYGDSRYFLGNVLDDADIRRRVDLPFDTSHFAECASCCIKHWCQPCGALNVGWRNAWTLPHRECTLRRAVFLRLARLSLWHLSVPRTPIVEGLLETDFAPLVAYCGDGEAMRDVAQH